MTLRTLSTLSKNLDRNDNKNGCQGSLLERRNIWLVEKCQPSKVTQDVVRLCILWCAFIMKMPQMFNKQLNFLPLLLSPNQTCITYLTFWKSLNGLITPRLGSFQSTLQNASKSWIVLPTYMKSLLDVTFKILFMFCLQPTKWAFSTTA